MLYTLAFLLALPVAAQIPTPHGRDAVAIFMEFDDKPSAHALSRMQQETAALLAPAGITPSWHTLPGSGSRVAPAPRVFVVRFKGSCRPGRFPSSDGNDDDLQPFASPTLRLASTRTRGQTVLPFAEVECDAIRRIAGAAPLRDGAQALGQALGRWSELLQATFDRQEFGIRNSEGRPYPSGTLTQR